MQEKGRNYRRLFANVILIVFAISFLVSCTAYNPSLYPSYDVLNPSEEVRLNPIGWTDDGNVIVNEAFILWVQELKEEVKKLRKQLK